MINEKEIEALDNDVEAYWKHMDKIDSNIDWEKEQSIQKNQFAEMLLGAMGKDMNEVMSGKVKVKLPLRLRIKYWFERFFKMFD